MEERDLHVLESARVLTSGKSEKDFECITPVLNAEDKSVTEVSEPAGNICLLLVAVNVAPITDLVLATDTEFDLEHGIDGDFDGECGVLLAWEVTEQETLVFFLHSEKDILSITCLECVMLPVFSSVTDCGEHALVN